MAIDALNVATDLRERQIALQYSISAATYRATASASVRSPSRVVVISESADLTAGFASLDGAIDVARRQNAKFFELRAKVSQGALMVGFAFGDHAPNSQSAPRQIRHLAYPAGAYMADEDNGRIIPFKAAGKKPAKIDDAFELLDLVKDLLEAAQSAQRLERVAAGLAGPQVTHPATVLVHILGSFRHEDRVATLCTGIDGPWKELTRILGTQLHDASSVCDMLGSPTSLMQPSATLFGVKQGD